MRPALARGKLSLRTAYSIFPLSEFRCSQQADALQLTLVPRFSFRVRLTAGVGPLSTRVSGEDWFLPFCASCPSAAGARAEGDQTRGNLVRGENPGMERRKSAKLALRIETSQRESQVFPGMGQPL